MYKRKDKEVGPGRSGKLDSADLGYAMKTEAGAGIALGAAGMPLMGLAPGQSPLEDMGGMLGAGGGADAAGDKKKKSKPKKSAGAGQPGGALEGMSAEPEQEPLTLQTLSVKEQDEHMLHTIRYELENVRNMAALVGHASWNMRWWMMMSHVMGHGYCIVAFGSCLLWVNTLLVWLVCSRQ